MFFLALAASSLGIGTIALTRTHQYCDEKTPLHGTFDLYHIGSAGFDQWALSNYTAAAGFDDWELWNYQKHYSPDNDKSAIEHSINKYGTVEGRTVTMAFTTKLTHIMSTTSLSLQNYTILDDTMIIRDGEDMLIAKALIERPPTDHTDHSPAECDTCLHAGGQFKYVVYGSSGIFTGAHTLTITTPSAESTDPARTRTCLIEFRLC